MKRPVFLILLSFLFAAEILALAVFASRTLDFSQDTVALNEAVQAVRADFGRMEDHRNHTALDYVVLDSSGAVLFRTRDGLSESINQAVIHRDTILDLEIDGRTEGKLILYNDSAELVGRRTRLTFLVTVAFTLLQGALCAAWLFYLRRVVIRPFRRLKDFACRVAGGNLDIPLEMDRGNLFGAFTESFDIMRSELKRARAAEAEADRSKRELIAKLSHDIKTPVASIKAASEVGAALADSEKLRNNYLQITRKADQIGTLVSNLFSAALDELSQLAVTPEDLDGRELETLLKNADYLQRAVIPAVPSCLVIADRLRLQQVFDNLFANSYKYAGTPIDLTAEKSDGHLFIVMEDSGGGVSAEELPLLRRKYRRGSNAGNIEGAGLGLYLADCFLREMHGELLLENGRRGLRVTVCLALSGTI